MNITIQKRNYRGDVELTYEGNVLERGADYVCVQALFGFDRDLDYVTLRKGDIFTEWFYNNRWYNVFRIQDKETQVLKGYYCNITRPANICGTYVAAEDLALDIFVKPDGTTLLLDEDEYHALSLSDDERREVKKAVDYLYAIIKRRDPPFDDLK